MMKKIILFLLPILIACGTTKKTADEGTIEEHITLDTLTISAPGMNPKQGPNLPPHVASATRKIDLLHTRLDLSINWAEQQVGGTAILSLKPYAMGLAAGDSIVLDAEDMELDSVINLEGKKPMQFNYDGRFLSIILAERLPLSRVLTVRIDYLANPTKTDRRREQGMYFIDPLDTIPDLPRQLWTQGETHSNRRWFPTIDQPNERCTQEILVRVEKELQTLSNGVLVNTTDHGDGTKTDHWQMDLPHAPYLFALVIGSFDVVTEPWGEIELAYYVDPGYGPDAKAIFANTPGMLSFFSDILRFPYPWSRYAQVPVKNYISGAMENTTAVIYGDFIQHHQQDMLVDGQNDDIIAHETIHQWFGDLLTCETWSQLVLNEGFASWGEFLWAEHHHGKDEGDRKRLETLHSYLRSANREIRPIIDHTYVDPNQMFDAHSYSKGAMVLHMLRHLLGDEVFFHGISTYLRDNAFSAVELDHLRLSFEKASGSDLTPFFQQWFLSQGHPKVRITESYDSTAQVFSLHIDQVHNTDSVLGAFRFPLDIDLYFNGGKHEYYRKEITRRNDTLRFAVREKPILALCDQGSDLLWDMVHEKTVEHYSHQLLLADGYGPRMEAAEHMLVNQDKYETDQLMAILKDPHWAIRQAGVMAWDMEVRPVAERMLISFVTDSLGDPRVKASAMLALARTLKEQYAPVLASQVMPGAKSAILYVGLASLANLNIDLAREKLKILHAERDNPALVAGEAEIYNKLGDPAYIPWYADRLDKMTSRYAGEFLESTMGYLLGLEDLSPLLLKVKEYAANTTRPAFLRFLTTRALYQAYSNIKDAQEENRLEKAEKLRAALNAILEAENEPWLQRRYSQFNLR